MRAYWPNADPIGTIITLGMGGFGRATLLAVVGIGFGLVLTVALTRLMTIMLYQVQPGDPATLVIVAFILGAVAMLACYLPARRAARVDPLVALRYG